MCCVFVGWCCLTPFPCQTDISGVGGGGWDLGLPQPAVPCPQFCTCGMSCLGLAAAWIFLARTCEFPTPHSKAASPPPPPLPPKCRCCLERDCVGSPLCSMDGGEPTTRWLHQCAATSGSPNHCILDTGVLGTGCSPGPNLVEQKSHLGCFGLRSTIPFEKAELGGGGVLPGLLVCINFDVGLFCTAVPNCCGKFRIIHSRRPLIDAVHSWRSLDGC